MRLSAVTSVSTRVASVLLAAVLCISVSGCRQKMFKQPKYHKPFEPSEFFASGNGMAARPRIEDTVARGQLRDDQAMFTGKQDGAVVTEFPMKVTKETLLRGQERFNIFCAPCHGRLGNGDGMIVRRGYSVPASFHEDRLLTAPVGHFVDVMTNGFGRMPKYSTQIPARDRWAITAYIRALQLSQRANIDDVPPAERDKLMAELEVQ